MLDYLNKYISYFVIILSVLGQQSWYKIYTLDLQTSIKHTETQIKSTIFKAWMVQGPLRGKHKSIERAHTRLTVAALGVRGPVIRDFNLSSTLNGYK